MRLHPARPRPSGTSCATGSGPGPAAGWVRRSSSRPPPRRSTASGSLEPRPAVLRTFAVADDARRGAGPATGSASCPADSPGSAPAPRLPDRSRAGATGPARTPGWRRPQPALQQSPWLRSARTTVRPPVAPDTGHRAPRAGGGPAVRPGPHAPSTPSWSSGSSVPSWPGSTSPSASAWKVAPSPCRSCWPPSATVSGFDPVTEPERPRPAAGGRPSAGPGAAGAADGRSPDPRRPDRPPGPGPAPRRRRRRQPGVVPRTAGRRRLLGAGAALQRHLAAGR